MSPSKPCTTSSNANINRSGNQLLVSTTGDSQRTGSNFLTPTLRARSPIGFRSACLNKSVSRDAGSSQFLQLPQMFGHHQRLSPSSPRNGQDRMIPCRSQTDLALAQHLLSPMSQRASGSHDQDNERKVTRILNFGCRTANGTKPLHTVSRSPLMSRASEKPRQRSKIPTKPDRVMAAPGTFLDCGSQSAHWAPSSNLVVALESGVYVCKIDEDSSVVEIRNNGEEPDDPFCHVLWNSEGNSVICSKMSGEIQVCNLDMGVSVDWSLTGKGELRSMALERQNLLTCGTVSNGIKIYDLRKPGGSTAQPILALKARSSVNSVAWSPNGHLLAGGCESGIVYLWDIRRPAKECSTLKEQEKSPIQVVSWCSWKPSVLLSGSSYPRPTICLQNTATGVTLGLVDCATEITGIQFNETLKQVATSHHSTTQDAAQNRQSFPGSDSSVQLWQFASSSLIPMLELGQHEDGIVSMASSVDSNHLLTMGGDELLCLWRWSETTSQVASNQAGHQMPRSQLDFVNLIR